MPFNKVTDNRAELDVKTLKKDKNFEEKLTKNFAGKIVKNLTSKKTNDASNFVIGQMVFCHHLGQYVQIKKKDVE